MGNLLCTQNKTSAFIHSVRSLSLTKNISWIKRMCLAEKIRSKNGYLIDESRVDNYLNFITSIMNVLDEFHPNDWDMHIEHDEDYNNNYNLSFIIRYKKIILENSLGQTKTLRDLFVVLPVGYNTISHVSDIYGTKAKFSPEDYEMGFVHSHLTSISCEANREIFEIKDFCLGSGDVVNLLYSLRMEFDIEIFKLFILNLKTFVSWESLEGGPYFKMEKTLSKYGRNEVVIGSRKHEYYKLFQDLIVNDLENFKVNYCFYIDRYIVKDDFTFKQTLLNIIKKDSYLTKKVIGKKHSDGIYYSFNDKVSNYNNYNISSSLTSKYTYIQGEKIYFSIIKTEQKPDNIEEFDVIPDFKKYIKEQIEQKIYGESIKKSERKLQDQTSHIRELIEQD